MHAISRKDFKTPGSSQRVCSAHFEGGKKTYENNIPTITPKLIKQPKIKQRRTGKSSGRRVTFEDLEMNSEDVKDPHSLCKIIDTDAELVLEKLISKIVITESQNKLIEQGQEIQNFEKHGAKTQIWHRSIQTQSRTLQIL